MYEAGSAMRSAYDAPITFGVISENTRIKNVTTTVPIARDQSLWPNKRIVIVVVSTAAPALIKLLPSKITPSKRSVRASRSAARFAPRLPMRAIAFRR